MEILRLLPYGSTSVTVQLPPANYVGVPLRAVITDMSDLSILSSNDIDIESQAVTSITQEIPNAYDADYRVEVRIIETGEIIADETFELRRPYVDANTKGTTASEIAEYAQNEEVARAIIESVIPEGFYYQKKAIVTTGLGTDYLPIWVDAKKVLKLYENNVLIYDADNASDYSRSFEISPNKASVIETYAGQLNRLESAPNILPGSPSDFIDINWEFRGFPRTFDYILVVAHGHPTVPSDIVKATELLVSDIACGKLDYFKRYVSDYNTDQFRIKFDAKSFEGTGNLIVDKILSKYQKSITTIGVL
jgi:hypothetical protein